ncbi:MAG TPA: hypothetical protein VHT29_01365 [Solirubrobacteraceae bacterium]|nr:hypothetical protein [Solirubrobacteraceae bacterium]
MNITLILGGLLLAPVTLTSLTGVGVVVADIGLQLTVLAVGLIGPASLDRLGSPVGYCLAAGVTFAIAYDVFLLIEFAGQPVPLSPYWFFFATAIVAAFAVGYRSQRVTQAVLAAVWSLILGTALWSGGFMMIAYAYWGTDAGNLFWVRDGAIDEFRHSGTTNVSVFLLQDIQGALFFHPLLSLGVGLLFGVAGASLGLGAVRLRRRPIVETP